MGVFCLYGLFFPVSHKNRFLMRRHLIFEMICESTKCMHFSNPNQPAGLLIDVYFCLLTYFETTPQQLRPLAVISFLEDLNMCLRRICSRGVCYQIGQSNFV